MTQWRVIEADRRTAYCPIALDLRDEFTGGAVLGRVEIELDLQHGPLWAPSGHRPVRSPSGLFVFTGLGHAVDPLALPSFKVRVRIAADYYRPAYRTTVDGLEFDVATYNHAVPPAVSPLMPEMVLMHPNSAYPFGGHLRVLRGRVVDPGGDPVADASIEADGVERVISDDRGAFGLPLRWQAANAAVAVLVDHPRSGLAAAAAFNLPGALTGNHDIQIT
ncbi:MAG TPA: carboxypeptidase-like regulatory domain-containing protein [Allosphingosinicella sp.]|nr:carboxypeptidase-like regulatory domain-containing protein [Allosphingosinicella sp.]